MTRSAQRYGVAWSAATVLGTLLGCGGEPEEAGPPPAPEVTVAEPVVRDITLYYHYSGNLAAVDDVELRARVGGFLEEQRYTASSTVEAGQVMFVIEPEPYEIALEAAEAQVERAEAQVELRQTEFDVIDAAYKQQAATLEERIEREADLKQAQAELRSAEADRRQAALDLSYTQVRSPIDGRASRELVDVGDLVGTSGTPDVLARVVKLDPIWVYVDVSERILQEYLERGLRGDVGDREDPPIIEVSRSIDPDGTFPYSGRVSAVDTEVDENTGTVRVRGTIDNPGGELFPGLFVRCRVPYDTQADAMLIETNAVGNALEERYVMVVDDGGLAQRRTVELGPDQGDGLVLVTHGLEPGDRYITRGIQKARPGEPVTIAPPEAESVATHNADADANAAADGDTTPAPTPES